MKIVNGIVAVVGALVMIAVLWSKLAGSQANGFVEQGNLKLQEGKQLSLAALEKLKAVEAAAFPQEAEVVRKLANEGADLYAQGVACFRESAVQFQSAADAVLENELKEYFSREQKSVAKLADLQESLRSYLLVYADPAISDLETLNLKKSPIEAQLSTISSEHKKLKAEADQYAAEHKDKNSKPQ
jgi:hypothetical protein